MRWLIVLVWLPGTLYAQEQQVIVGEPFSVGASHDLMNHEGYRLYIDGALWSEVRQASPCDGLWTFGPTGETLRNGIHVGQGNGMFYRCVAGVVFVWSGDVWGWYRWTGTAWQSVGMTGPAPPMIEVPGRVTALGLHVLEVATYRGMEEVKAMSVTVRAVVDVSLPQPQTPTGARVQ